MIASIYIKIYSIMWVILTPFIPLILLWRVFLNKEDFSRLNERIGLPNKNKFKERLIWINAVSVGEVRSIIPLAEELSKKNKVLITSVTSTSAEHIKNFITKNNNIIHQFSPLDHPISINLFLRHWKPDLIIFVESEIWPNMILKSYKAQIPLVLIQARISDKTFLRWKTFSNLSDFLFKKFKIIITQDLETKNKFLNLGAKNILAEINLKNLSRAPRARKEKEKDLIEAVKSRPILLFASIHDEIEENASIISHFEASKLYKDLLSIIIPRHPQKTKNLVKQSKIYNLNFEIRSNGKLPTNKTNIYIANTIGEIGTFFSLSDICFVGGSLSNKGGHNLIEPALEKCSIIFGPDISNHKISSEILIKANAAIQIKDSEELQKNICALLNNKSERERLGFAAHKALQNMPNPIYKILKILDPILTNNKGH